MTELLRQLPALVGVVVGALASYLVTAAHERARWRRDQQRRWDERRIGAYVDFSNAVKRISQLILRIMAYRGLHPHGHPLPPEEGFVELYHADNDRAIKWEALLLLGTPGVVQAARQWHQAIGRLEEIVRSDTCDDVEWSATVEEFLVVRSNFYNAARNDLGIGEEPLPPLDPFSTHDPRAGLRQQRNMGRLHHPTRRDEGSQPSDNI